MRIILFILLFFYSFFAPAQDCTEDIEVSSQDNVKEITTDVPEHLKGATITVKTRDGRESTVPAEKFKVVPRVQQFVVTEHSSATVKTCVVPKGVSEYKNRVSALGGVGANEGLDRVQVSPSVVEVESRMGTVLGAQYQYMFADRWSVLLQGQTNKTGSLGVGFDF